MAAGVARERLSMKLAKRLRSAASGSASMPPAAAAGLVTASIPGMAVASREIAPAATLPHAPGTPAWPARRARPRAARA